MIYSQWKADGGYDYYATPARRALGSDLPSPTLIGVNPIGVASTDVGRPLPSGARKVGSGQLARGQVVPMSSVGVLGSLAGSVSDLALLAGAVLLGWWLRGTRRKAA